MKAAFAYWESRIAPVFDTARRIHIVEVEAGRIVREGQDSLPGDPPVRKALHLAESGIDTLVCGAISRPLHGMIVSHGIRVIPFVAGEMREIIKAWRCGNLRGNAFAMPGCHRRGPRRFRGVRGTTKEGLGMPEDRNGERGAGGGWGQGRGQGRGQGGGRGPMGPGGPRENGESCICYQCGYRDQHEAGVPCRTKVCPRCGGEMGRE